MLKVDFSVAGDAQFLRGFSRFGDRIKDLSPAFREMAKNFHEQVETQQFSTEGASGSAGWQPLSPGYARWKAIHFPGRPLMVKEGPLKASLAGKTSDTIERVGKQELVLGTKVRYAIFHQKGRGVPARPVIQLSEADKARWGKGIHRFLVAALKEGYV